MSHYFVLGGILIVILGFALRLNPMLVVTVAALATGLLAKMGIVEIVSLLGRAFVDKRIVAVVWVVLPVVGLLERYGLRHRAATLIREMKAATVGRLLIVYLLFRQATAALGLTSIAGHPQTVRPLVVPMALAAAEKEHGPLDEATSERVKAMSAATDNVGLFFGEDIFLAVSSIALIQSTLAGYGYVLRPFQLSVWAIPTALCATLIHGARLKLLDRRLSATARAATAAARTEDGR
jgi:uncharacterized membrane protein